MRRLVLGLWLASASAWAWQAQSEVTFSANSKLVQVSVIAQDRLDKPVTGLRREDFRLFDNGKPQEVCACPPG